MNMTKAEQQAEAAARAEAAGSVPGEVVSDINDSAGEGNEGGSHQQVERDEPRDDNGRPKPIHMSPADQARLDMAKRFRRQGAEEDVPFNGNLNDPEMLYGKSGREALEPEPDEPDILVPQAKTVMPKETNAPKRTLTVRGRQVEMTDDEILAAAQKTLAGDSYLDEARSLLEEAKQIKAERAGRAPQHPEGEHNNSTQYDRQDVDPQSRQHPDELEEAIEQIQFGDPKEAAAKIRKVMKTVSEQEADEGQMRRLVKNDIARSQAVVKAFSEKNPTIANDQVAAQALEQFVYQITREEIEKLGDVDASKIPQNSAELANWHRFYRINGRAVSTPDALLESAKGRYEKWKGVSGQTPSPAAQAKPRVVVNVDRDQRRAAIPNQPTRSMSPTPDALTRQPQGKSRSDVIMAMRKQRGQTVA
jgi:hypothetical protein